METCQLSAVSMSDTEKATVDLNRCVGCGACASLCPVEAIAMAPYDDVPTPPGTARELQVTNAFISPLYGNVGDHLKLPLAIPLQYPAG